MGNRSKIKLSIITVCLNEEKLIDKTCSSIINQSYENIEWIVIDGGSTDKTLQILESYKDYMAYFSSEKDDGIYHGLNKGIYAASGSYILFINGGDFLFDNNTIDKVVDEINNEDLIFGYLKILDKEIYPFKDYSLKRDYIYYYPLPLPAAIFKRELFEKYGYFDENYKIAGDQDYFLRCLKNKKVILKKIMIPVTVFNLEGLGSTSVELTKIENKMLKKKNYSVFERFYYQLIYNLKSLKQHKNS